MRAEPANSRRPRWWLLAWGLVTLFMMAWAFVLGLFVGQGSLATPEQLASLKEAGRAVPGLGLLAKSEPPPPPEQPQPRDLTFYQEVERRPDQAAVTATTAAPAATAATASTASTASTATTQTSRSTATTVAPVAAAPTTTTRPPFTPQPYVPPAGQARTPQPFVPQAAQPHVRPAPAPAAPQAAPSNKGKFTVQVASFKEQAQAHELLAQLKASGHPAYLVTTNLEGVGTRFRVRVGPYPDLDAAQGAAARIRMQLLLAAYVTRED